MIITLLTGLLASTMLTTSVPAPEQVVDNPTFASVLSQVEFSDYIVQEGDYLSAIAMEFYDSEDYWTNIWNDNPELKDAAVLEEGMTLKIRKSKTLLPEEVKTELAERVDVTSEAYNTDYAYSTESGASAVTTVVTSAPVTSVPQVTAAPVTVQTTSNAPQVLNDAQITYLGSCEAGMDPAKNTGNGYYGAFQFSAGTWNSMGTGYARADLAPLEVQKDAVQRLIARSSIFTQFPGCAKKMRSIGLI